MTKHDLMFADRLLHICQWRVADPRAVHENLSPWQRVDVHCHARDCKRDRGSASREYVHFRALPEAELIGNKVELVSARREHYAIDFARPHDAIALQHLNREGSF